MAAPDDANLDELRRRARRRLVGAIVLALAVAVVVPMLLESDPKPLGEDVSVKIPPMDDGKFVNRLGDKGKSEAPKMAAKAEAPKADASKSPAPSPETPKADAPKDDAAKAEPPKEPPKDAVKEPPKDALKEPPKDASKDSPKDPVKDPPPAPSPAKAAPEPAAKDAPAKDAAAKDAPPKDDAAKDAHPKEASKDSGEFAVQVFAFSDDKGAISLVNKLKAKGFPAYSEPVATSRGTLWRVRVGPFPSRDGANAARDKLKREGYNGIVAAR